MTFPHLSTRESASGSLTHEPAAPVGAHAHLAAREGEVYYPWFDWLRIVLATCVVLAHAYILTGEQAGNFPVQVFFALSGWLIGGILLRTQPAAMLRFYYARATRIWIPYAVALGLLLSVSVLRDPITVRWAEFVFYKATFVYNLFGPSQLAEHAQEMPLQGTGNHFWSICAEEQFYLLAPFLLVFWPKVGRSPWTWLAVLAGLLVVGQYGSISAGVLAAVLQARVGDWHRKPLAQALLLAVVVGTSGLMLAEVLPYAPTVPFTAVAIVLLAARAGTKQRVAGFLGGLSYPLYLNHWLGMFIGHAVAKRMGVDHGLMHAWFGLPLAFGISTLLYLAVDKTILARRNRWYSARLGWGMTIAAYGLMAIGLLGGALFQRALAAPSSAGARAEVQGMPATDSTINAAPIR